jgi:hypothetical protein
MKIPNAMRPHSGFPAFRSIACLSWKGRIVERSHFSGNRFSIHGREFTSGALRSPSKFRSSIAADIEQISSQNYMIKTLGL